MNLGILASHEGTTLQSVLDACANGRVRGRVSVVISNNGNAGALVRARAAGIPAHHLSSKTHSQAAAFDAAIRDALVAAQVELVFLGGYMRKLGPLTLQAFTAAAMNISPALWSVSAPHRHAKNALPYRIRRPLAPPGHRRLGSLLRAGGG